MYKLLVNPVKRLPTWLLVIIGNEIERDKLPEYRVFCKTVDKELEERCQLEFLDREVGDE